MSSGVIDQLAVQRGREAVGGNSGTVCKITPEPFRRWADRRIVAITHASNLDDPEGKIAPNEVLAAELQIGIRRLHTWRHQARHLVKNAVEDALWRAGVAFEDVYGELDLNTRCARCGDCVTEACVREPLEAAIPRTCAAPGCLREIRRSTSAMYCCKRCREASE